MHMARFYMPFCWRGWSYLDTDGVTDSCLTYLQSGPANMNTTLPTNYSLYPGDCIYLSNDFTVYDAWECDITSDVNLQLDIISGNLFRSGIQCEVMYSSPSSTTYWNNRRSKLQTM